MEEEKIKIIENNTNLAIKAMNNEWSFEKAKSFLEEAFSACSPNKDLGYYNIISDILLSLQFKTKHYFQTKKVREAYASLFEYLSTKFSHIRHFGANVNDDEEAMLVNEICVNCYNRMIELASAFIEVAARNYYWGLIVGAISTNLIKKKFKGAVASIAHNAAFILRKYSINDVNIQTNIRMFENEK